MGKNDGARAALDERHCAARCVVRNWRVKFDLCVRVHKQTGWRSCAARSYSGRGTRYRTSGAILEANRVYGTNDAALIRRQLEAGEVQRQIRCRGLEIETICRPVRGQIGSVAPFCLICWPGAHVLSALPMT